MWLKGFFIKIKLSIRLCFLIHTSFLICRHCWWGLRILKKAWIVVLLCPLGPSSNIHGHNNATDDTYVPFILSLRKNNENIFKERLEVSQHKIITNKVKLVIRCATQPVVECLAALNWYATWQIRRRIFWRRCATQPVVECLNLIWEDNI